MENKSENKSLMTKEIYIILALSLFKFVIHLVVNFKGGYGIFRDEFYYLACADHLSWGYVDHPPFSIFVLSIWKFIFGDSLFSIRFLPALAGGLTVFMTGLIIKKLEGNITAIAIGCLAVIAAPVLLAMNSIYSMNSIDILLWTLAAYVLIKIIKENRSAHWITLGVLIGVGLLNKISMGWFAAGLVAAVIVTKQRYWLKTKWPYMAGIIALAIFLPYIIWNIANDYAHLEFIRNASAYKYGGVSAIDFIFGQPTMMMPLSALIWIAGLYYFLVSKNGKRFSALGIVYITVVIILVINGHSKPEYLSPTYPALFAAGAVFIEIIIRKKYLSWLKYALPVLMLIMGAAMAPVAFPCLPVETYLNYARTIGIEAESPEGHELTELHQFYADMFGWENLAATVSGVYQSLPDSDKAEVAILASNYGKAGAIDYYSERYPLPPVISGHNSYHLWDRGDVTGEVIILIGGVTEDVLEFYETYSVEDTVVCRYCIPYENNLPVYICRGLKVPFDRILSEMKIYI